MSKDQKTTTIPPTFDFAIIGGGFAGLATAYFLAQSGRSGIILEKADHIAAHASGKNAGMFRQLHSDLLVFELANRSRHFFANPQRQNLFEERGSILLTHEAKGHEPLVDYPTPMGKWGTSERLTRHEALQRLSYLQHCNFSTAIHTPSDGMIDLQGLAAYLLGEAMAGGFMLRLQSEVQGVTVNNQEVILRTNHGPVNCRTVVNAAGAWSGEIAKILGGQAIPLKPLKRHVIKLKQPDWLPDNGAFIWHLDDNYYFRPVADGVLSSPCDEILTAPGDEEVVAGIEQQFTKHLQGKCRALGEMHLLETWACLRTYAPDKRPLVGWDGVQPWLFWVTALGGHGVTTCAAIGEYATTLLLAGRQQQLDKNSGMQLSRF